MKNCSWLTESVSPVFQGCPTMHRLAAVSGLVALVGSESCIIHVRRHHIGWFSEYKGLLNAHIIVIINACSSTVFENDLQGWDGSSLSQFVPGFYVIGSITYMTDG